MEEVFIRYIVLIVVIIVISVLSMVYLWRAWKKWKSETKSENLMNFWVFIERVYLTIEAILNFCFLTFVIVTYVLVTMWVDPFLGIEQPLVALLTFPTCIYFFIYVYLAVGLVRMLMMRRFLFMNKRVLREIGVLRIGMDGYEDYVETLRFG